MIKLEDMTIYRISMKMGDEVWDIVLNLPPLSNNTIGNQIVRSADSVSANFAEGYGRFFFKERRKFCYYSRGSLMETKTWMIKLKNRNLISAERYKAFYKQYTELLRQLNTYIKSINQQIAKGKT